MSFKTREEGEPETLDPTELLSNGLECRTGNTSGVVRKDSKSHPPCFDWSLLSCTVKDIIIQEDLEVEYG